LKSTIKDPYLLDVWSKAVLYHFIHGFGGLFAAIAPAPSPLAASLFLGGTVLFSGSLYTMTLTNVRALGAITPIGGLVFIAGWVALAFAR